MQIDVNKKKENKECKIMNTFISLEQTGKKNAPKFLCGKKCENFQKNPTTNTSFRLITINSKAKYVKRIE